VSKLSTLPPREKRIPNRSPYMVDDVWLITLFVRDDELIPLVRHLKRAHGVTTVGDLDAVGWNCVNTFGGRIRPEKLVEFFAAIGRKTSMPDSECESDDTKVIPFEVRPSSRSTPPPS